MPGSVVGIATGYGLDCPGIESQWGGVRFSAPMRMGPGAHPASCTMGTGSFLGAKSGQGVTLTPHPFLVPWSRKSRAIPLLPLWAVRPVQSLSACTRVHFTFYFMCVLHPGQVYKSQSASVQDAEQPYWNVKALVVHAMEVYMGVGVWLHLFLTLH